MLDSEGVEPLFVASETSALYGFDWALVRMREGKKVTRKSWNNNNFSG